MKKIDVELCNKVYVQLKALHNEITLLSRKSPTDAVNKFKLKLINTILEAANKLLGEKYKPFDQFTVFNEDDLPNNGDVAVVLSQYLGCMEKLREDNAIY
jgi:oligoendopeptidase F